jgi:hypothetical protein
VQAPVILAQSQSAGRHVSHHCENGRCPAQSWDGLPRSIDRSAPPGDLDIVIGALPDNRRDPYLRFLRLTWDMLHVVGRQGHAFAAQARTLVDFADSEASRAHVQAAKLPEPDVAIETDSLSLMLATLRTTDCLGLMTSQILTQPEAHGVVSIDLDTKDHLQAGIQRNNEPGFACSPPPCAARGEVLVARETFAEMRAENPIRASYRSCDKSGQPLYAASSACHKRSNPSLCFRPRHALSGILTG